METARSLAVQTLLKAERDASFSTLSLANALSRSRLSGPERALASQLVYGVTERRLTLDDQLARCLQKPPAKLHPQVLAVLRVGA